MKVDTTKTGQENMISLIKRTNGGKASKISTSTVSLSNVIAVRAGTGLPNPTHNAIVTVTAIPDAGMTGSVEIHYRRLTLTEGVVNPQLVYDVDDSTTMADLLVTICNALKLRPTEMELTQPLMRPQSGTTSVQIIRQRTNNYTHTGQQTLQLNWLPKQ
jgi:hypothetical protein